MAEKDELGMRGERIAENALARLGYEILDRNWRCPEGEVDLVARDGDAVVVIEVKTRSSTMFGHPFESITPRKLARLRRLATSWLHAHGPVAGTTRIRIDAIGVIAPRDAPASIEHLEGIF
ncbi:MAG: YraN family protein [Pseudolysinimonas sp.]|uniref:YraN family protein n=1 Tax=Pseudolysinimonas sp. TaxID=2680009 RepID=UPI0032639447